MRETDSLRLSTHIPRYAHQALVTHTLHPSHAFTAISVTPPEFSPLWRTRRSRNQGERSRSRQFPPLRLHGLTLSLVRSPLTFSAPFSTDVLWTVPTDFLGPAPTDSLCSVSY